jgi:hypothetical protein
MDLLEKEGELQPRGKLLLTSSAGFWELTVEISCGPSRPPGGLCGLASTGLVGFLNPNRAITK